MSEKPARTNFQVTQNSEPITSLMIQDPAFIKAYGNKISQI
jgi:hypothetical protein